MESIPSLFSTLSNLTLLGVGLFFILKMLQLRRNQMTKNELQKFQARLSILRMALKSKVKKRVNSFRVYFTKVIIPNEPLDLSLTELVDNKFESSDEFQKYFDQIKTTQSIVAKLPVEIENSAKKFLETDTDFDLVIVKMMKEMKELSSRYNIKVSYFNKLNPKKKLDLLDPMHFQAMAEIERRLKDEQDKEIVLENDDIPKVA